MRFSFSRLVTVFLVLSLLISFLPAIPVEAEQVSQTQQRDSVTYMTLEQAGAYLAQKMAAREQNFSLYFKVEDPSVMESSQAWDAVLNEANKHIGNGKYGDALRWAQQQAGYGGVDDYNDGTAYYAKWDNMSLTYYTSAQQEQELDQKVAQILSSLNLNGKSDYQKIEAIYKYVCQNVAYAQKAIDGTYAPDTPDWYRCYSAYGALCRGEATCQGFSVAIYRLMLDAGIDCRLLAGDDHGWNIVKLDGKYYYLDATWDSDAWRASGTLNWFLKGSANFRDYGHREWNFYASDDYNKYAISTLDYGAEVYAPSDTIASGNCGNEGNNIMWNLTGDGTLTLTGTGATTDAVWLYAPWQGYTGYIKKLVIGDGITSIGTYLFYNCTALTQIQFPSTLTTIRDRAFAFCTSLTELTLPNTITELGGDVFSSCFYLKKFSVSGNMTKIAPGMFMNCIRLEDVVLNNKITEIGAKGFANCGKLKGMTLPSSLTHIGSEAFVSAFDSKLKVKLVIPENVVSVGNTCFAWSYLKEVDWKAKTPTMEFWTFYNCRHLEKVTISDHVTFIDYECFQWNTLLKEVKLSNKLQNMGNSVFCRCTSLKQISLPTSLTVISNNAFDNAGLESIVLHEGITTIAPWAFGGSKLKEVTLPTTLTMLGNGAFSGCDSLRKVTFLGNAPSTDGGGLAPLHNIQGTAYFPYGNNTWTDTAMRALNGETAGLVWKTKHPAGAAHVPIDDPQMKHDEHGHWQECRGCEEKLNYKEHNLSEYMLDGEQWVRYCMTCWATIYYDKGPDQNEQACLHTYDNACDTSCNNCGSTRAVPGHAYDHGCDAECNNCGATRSVSGHVYDHGCDTSCNNCYETRNVNNHTYDHACDADCNNCGATRNVSGHSYSNTYDPDCNYCGATRDVPQAPTEPDPTEPKPTEPDSTEPSTTEPSTTEPDSTEPSTTEPGSSESKPTQPSNSGFKPTVPASTNSGSSESKPNSSDSKPTDNNVVVIVIVSVVAVGGIAAGVFFFLKKKKISA